MSGASLRERLRDALRAAMKARDAAAVAALRAALAVIDNAEAAEPSSAPAAEPGHIAGGVAGLGSGEVPRRRVPDDQLVELLHAELARWESTARACDDTHRPDDAARLREEIAVLGPFLTE